MVSYCRACGLLLFLSLFSLIKSDDTQAAEMHNPLHDSKLTHDKE